jgi:hypothetical protein
MFLNQDKVTWKQNYKCENGIANDDNTELTSLLYVTWLTEPLSTFGDSSLSKVKMLLFTHIRKRSVTRLYIRSYKSFYKVRLVLIDFITIRGQRVNSTSMCAWTSILHSGHLQQDGHNLEQMRLNTKIFSHATDEVCLRTSICNFIVNLQLKWKSWRVEQQDSLECEAVLTAARTETWAGLWI